MILDRLGPACTAWEAEIFSAWNERHEMVAQAYVDHWPNDWPNEHSRQAYAEAAHFAAALINCMPDLRPEQARPAVELYALVNHFVYDPHDWDYVGTVKALLEWVDARDRAIPF